MTQYCWIALLVFTGSSVWVEMGGWRRKPMPVVTMVGLRGWVSVISSSSSAAVAMYGRNHASVRTCPQWKGQWAWWLREKCDLKETVHPKILTIYCPPLTHGAFYPSLLIWCELQSFGHISHRYVCLYYIYIYIYIYLTARLSRVTVPWFSGKRCYCWVPSSSIIFERWQVSLWQISKTIQMHK